MEIASPTHADAAENRAIKSLVSDCCQELHLVPDLAVHLAICDRIAQNPYANGEEFIKQIYKELDSRKPAVQYLALKLLETCMKNSGPELYRLVAQKKLMNLMAEHASGKKNSGFLSKFQSDDLDSQRKKQEVQDLACVLVKGWAEAFVTIQKEVPLFMETYIKLQRDGVRFPQLVEEDRNYVTPAPFIPEDTQAPVSAQHTPLSQPYSQTVTGAPVGVAAPAPAGGMPNLSDAKEQADLLKEILGTLEPGAQILEMDFVMEMSMAVRAAQAGIQANAEAVNDEGTLMQVVAAVESIDASLELLARLQAAAPQAGSAQQATQEAAIVRQLDDTDLDDVQLDEPPPMVVMEPVSTVQPEDDLMDLLGGSSSAASVAPPPPQQAVVPQQTGMIGMQAASSQQGAAGTQQGEMMGMQPQTMGLQQGMMGMQPQTMGLQQGMMGMQPQTMGLQQGMMGMQPQTMGLQQGMMGMLQQGMTGMSQGMMGMPQQQQQSGMMVPAQQSQGVAMMGMPTQTPSPQQGVGVPALHQAATQPSSQVDIDFLSMPPPPMQQPPPVQQPAPPVQQPPPSFEEAARSQSQPQKGLLPPPPSAKPRKASKSPGLQPKSLAGVKEPAPLDRSDSFEAFFGGQGIGSQQNSSFDNLAGHVSPSHTVSNRRGSCDENENEERSLIG